MISILIGIIAIAFISLAMTIAISDTRAYVVGRCGLVRSKLVSVSDVLRI